MQTLPLEKIRKSSNFIAQVSGDVGYLPRIHMLVVEYQLMEDRDNLIGVLYKFIVDPFNARPHARWNVSREWGFVNTLVNTHETLVLLGGADTTS